jgi:hypothetical protein
MIATFSRALQTALTAQGCPVPVVEGPERGGTRSMVSRIVVERDRGSDEAVTAGVLRAHNPKCLATRHVAVVIRIFAQSTADGADVRRHEALADAIADIVMVQWMRLGQSSQRKPVLWGAARMYSQDDLEMAGLQTWPGAVYELRTTLERAVLERDWSEAAKAEVDLGTDFEVLSRTSVDGELACGVEPTP